MTAADHANTVRGPYECTVTDVRTNKVVHRSEHTQPCDIDLSHLEEGDYQIVWKAQGRRSSMLRRFHMHLLVIGAIRIFAGQKAADRYIDRFEGRA